MHLVQLPWPQQSRQNGLALIEVLLSLGLSSVMFLVLFTAQAYSQKVLIYSQQLHFANGLLDQVANQAWAYPKHFQLLASASTSDVQCLHGRYCAPEAMTQAWAAYWQSELQQLPNGALSVLCLSSCLPGGTLLLGLMWSQTLAPATDDCQRGVACVHLSLAL
jgi:hypothetical protein|tara:strand:+ start:132 stop:620 length:489 start_codon:yes stop_codon:yes gene_type:complete